MPSIFRIFLGVALFGATFHSIGALNDEWIGTWTGKAEEGASLYPFELFLASTDDGRLAGVISYPKHKCQSNLTPVPTRTGYALSFKEKLVKGRCADGGSVSLVRNDTEVVWHWYRSTGKLQSRGKMTRAEPSTEFAALVNDFSIDTEALDQPQVWKGRMYHLFKYATEIDLVLFKPYAKKFSGLVGFKGKSPYCIGELNADEKNPARLKFQALNDNCGALEGGSFVGYTPGDRQSLKWESADPNNTLHDAIHSLGRFVLYKQAPLELADLIDIIRNGGDANESMELNKKEVASVQKSLAQDAKKTYRSKFEPLELVGIWSGDFLLKEKVHKVELALWATDLHKSRTVAGFLQFEQGCQMGLNVNLPENPVSFGFGLQVTDVPICDTKQFGMHGREEGVFELDPSGMRLRLIIPDNNQSCESVDNNVCGIRTILQKSKPSTQITEILQSSTFKLVEAPQSWSLDVMQSSQVPDASMREEHRIALGHSEQMLGQLEIDRKKAEQLAHERDAERYRKRRAIEREIAGDKSNNDYASNATPSRKPKSQVNGPFNGLPGANYLNAIYHGDLSEVNAINQHYSETKQQQMRSWMGDEPHWTDRVFKKAFKAIKIHSSVAAVYLFNYEKRSKACLKSDAETFYVEGYVPDIVTTNLLGVEMWRTHGYSYSYEYHVNREFAPVFRKVGLLKPEGTSAGLSDLLLNQGGTDIRREVVKGIHKVQNNFDCNSAEIQQFEKNLRSLF